MKAFIHSIYPVHVEVMSERPYNFFFRQAYPPGKVNRMVNWHIIYAETFKICFEIDNSCKTLKNQAFINRYLAWCPLCNTKQLVISEIGQHHKQCRRIKCANRCSDGFHSLFLLSTECKYHAMSMCTVIAFIVINYLGDGEKGVFNAKMAAQSISH